MGVSKKEKKGGLDYYFSTVKLGVSCVLTGSKHLKTGESDKYKKDHKKYNSHYNNHPLYEALSESPPVLN